MDIKKRDIILSVLFFTLIVILLVGINFSLDNNNSEDIDSTSTVEILNKQNDTLAIIDVEIADTRKERYIGLSNTETLNNGSGMLFVFDQEQEQTFVMRDMDYPLDIIFINSERQITEIHHASVPSSNNNLTGYRGNARWVLEVPKGYTITKNISIGHKVEFNLNETS